MIWFLRRSSSAEVVEEEVDDRLFAVLESTWEAFSRAEMELWDNDILLFALESISEVFWITLM